MLHKLRHLWAVGPGLLLVSKAEYIDKYRCGHCDGRGRPYTVKGRSWCWIRRVLRRLGRDPNNRYGWFWVGKDVSDG